MAKPNRGEDIAVKYLKRHHMKILDRNYSCKYGEVDIIIKDKDIIAFVEVKQRKNDMFGRPMDFVTKAKQQRIKRAADRYVQENELSAYFRFDIVEILGDEINYIKNAFY